MTETLDGLPAADYALPDAVGLCPDHGGEFYMPIELPLSNPFVRCPVGGCERLLVLYSPAGASGREGSSR